MTAKIKKSNTQLSGKELGKKLIRQQIGEWFAKSRSKKENFMKNKSEPTPITQEEIDIHVKKFIEKGGVIKKLEPLNVILSDEDEEYDELDTNPEQGIRKILNIKIDEVRY